MNKQTNKGKEEQIGMSKQNKVTGIPIIISYDGYGR